MKFGIIYADPPWRYEDSLPNRKIENHYDTMSLSEICNLDVPSDDDCVLYLWATAPKLEEALQVLRAWGFKYRTCAIWDKAVIGMGYWFRQQHELLLVGVKGKPKCPAASLRISSIFNSKRGGHSAKPSDVRKMIERQFQFVPRLEMFARVQHPGWQVFGNEVMPLPNRDTALPIFK